MAAFAVVRSVVPFLLVAVVNTVADRASSGVKTTYIAALVPPATRGELARQPVASHVGYTLGAAAGAIALDTTAVFSTLTSPIYAGLSLWVTTVAAQPRTPSVIAQHPPRSRVPRCSARGQNRRSRPIDSGPYFEQPPGRRLHRCRSTRLPVLNWHQQMRLPVVRHRNPGDGTAADQVSNQSGAALPTHPQRSQSDELHAYALDAR